MSGPLLEVPNKIKMPEPVKEPSVGDYQAKLADCCAHVLKLSNQLAQSSETYYFMCDLVNGTLPESTPLNYVVAMTYLVEHDVFTDKLLNDIAANYVAAVKRLAVVANEADAICTKLQAMTDKPGVTEARLDKALSEEVT